VEVEKPKGVIFKFEGVITIQQVFGDSEETLRNPKEGATVANGEL